MDRHHADLRSAHSDAQACQQHQLSVVVDPIRRRACALRAALGAGPAGWRARGMFPLRACLDGLRAVARLVCLAGQAAQDRSYLPFHRRGLRSGPRMGPDDARSALPEPFVVDGVDLLDRQRTQLARSEGMAGAGHIPRQRCNAKPPVVRRVVEWFNAICDGAAGTNARADDHVGAGGRRARPLAETWLPDLLTRQSSLSRQPSPYRDGVGGGEGGCLPASVGNAVDVPVRKT